METHSTLSIGAAKTCCSVGSTSPAMLASSCPRKAPTQPVPTTSQRYAGHIAIRGRGGCSARSGLSADTTPRYATRRTTHDDRGGARQKAATCRRDMLGTCTYDGKGGRIDRGGGWIDASRRSRVRATERGRAGL